MAEMLAGKCTDAQIAGLLVALHMKGETVEEIVGFAEAIRAAATPLGLPPDHTLDVSGTGRDALVDTCGTGGDASGTFNISTATALVVAGAGVRVAKHGNRSVTSKCGSADVMESAGCEYQSASRAAGCLPRTGRDRVSVCARDAFGDETCADPRGASCACARFSILLGPLTNPAHASAQVVGVYSAELVETLAEALSMLGFAPCFCRAWAGWVGRNHHHRPYSHCGGARSGTLRTYEVTPEEFGMKRGTLDDIAGGDAAANAAIIAEVLAGKKSARRDVVLLNAAAALVAAGKADHLGDALPLAANSIDSGAAGQKLRALVQFTNAEQ